MNKKLFLILCFCCAFLFCNNSYAQEIKTEKKLIGYAYTWKTKKVKVQKKTYLGKFRITHYCSCSRCCGKWSNGVTASGRRAKAGRTVAVNRRLIKFGTKLKIGKKSGYVAEDTGGGLRSKNIDIFCSSHREALKRGVCYKKVWSIKTVIKKKKYKIKKPIYE